MRFALCWLIPTWLMFELLPTKLAHYSLPAQGALFMLMAAALRAPVLAAIPETAELLLSANIGCRLHLSGGRAVQHPLEFMAHYLA